MRNCLRAMSRREEEGKRIMGINNIKVHCIYDFSITKSTKMYQKYVRSGDGRKKEQLEVINLIKLYYIHV
jgi:hypothetical protein